MSDPNPFAPPRAPVADVSGLRPYPDTLRIAFLVLLLVQAVASWRYAGFYWKLVNTGAISLLVLLLTLLGTISLYVAASFVFRKRPEGQIAFIVAALSLGGAVPLWGWSYPWAWLVGFGALLAAFGVYLIARSRAAT